MTPVNRNRLKTNIAVPRPVRPSNLKGITDNTNATPPVDIVDAYQAKVKCSNRSFHVRLVGSGGWAWSS